MAAVNWEKFASLPGAATSNFEFVCRSLIRGHYGQFGAFRALANQPGVEFHLKVHTACSLGEPNRFYGWQCRWYDLPPGKALGSMRRGKIREALVKTRRVLPDLTDWVLWTKHTLTKGDQDWFFALKTELALGFELHLYTTIEVEQLLCGPGELLRASYFGEHVLTPEVLARQHAISVASIQKRWQPEVHQVLETERAISRALLCETSWEKLLSSAIRLESGTDALERGSEPVLQLVASARELAGALRQLHKLVAIGNVAALEQELEREPPLPTGLRHVVRRLRAQNDPSAPLAQNLFAELLLAHDAVGSLRRAVQTKLLAVVGDAGFGKTETAAQLTAPKGSRLAGVLLHGRDLPALGRLDDLSSGFIVGGVRMPSFEALLVAVEAAGARSQQRLPIVIDGLNEAEDPRRWKTILAGMTPMLEGIAHVVVVCTLRSAFVGAALSAGTEQTHLRGFEHDAAEARKRYFEYYRIDATDALLPKRLLNHPLTLRMFCEVANPSRKQTVGVEAIPSSLTGLFDKYLEQAADRIYELSSQAALHYAADVRVALGKVGFALWQANARSIPIRDVKALLDDERQWEVSLVRALEQEGLLIRISGQDGAGDVAIVFDLLAGHIVADALLDEHAGGEFEQWFRENEACGKFNVQRDNAHPLASDIFSALVHLSPRRRHRQQLWPLLHGARQQEALLEAALLEIAFLDGSTVEELKRFIREGALGRRNLLSRLRATRASSSHPLNARFLDDVLRKMTPAVRDLQWSEWLRGYQAEVIADLESLEARWNQPGSSSHSDELRALWVMWTLTSSVRRLRDHSTRTLFAFGCAHPTQLFKLTLDSLVINDPYVPERMLAASYGVASSLWCDPAADRVRDALPTFAASLVDRIFVPGAPSPTQHVLMRDSALGLIEIALRIAPDCVAAAKKALLTRPVASTESALDETCEWDPERPSAADSAIGMDFGNYTIGRLVPNRSPYDFSNPSYRRVRGTIERRILDLGYSLALEKLDRSRRGDDWRYETEGKVDRYGKKYAWIAYFEAYGAIEARGQLPERGVGERAIDVDIDPSFPDRPMPWRPQLLDIFSDATVDRRRWMFDGPTPRYGHLLQVEAIDGVAGPWLLLDGFIQERSGKDAREVFTFLRGILVSASNSRTLCRRFEERPYPGNGAIPEAYEDHHVYAGEIPWSRRFGQWLRSADGSALPDRRTAFDEFNGGRTEGVEVEVPAYEFAWQSSQSELNQAGRVAVPAPALCQTLQLSRRRGEWDLYDLSGRKAALFRSDVGSVVNNSAHALFLRRDLLQKYLRASRQQLVWLVWGEREWRTDGGAFVASSEHSKYRHVHKTIVRWKGLAAQRPSGLAVIELHPSAGAVDATRVTPAGDGAAATTPGATTGTRTSNARLKARTEAKKGKARPKAKASAKKGKARPKAKASAKKGKARPKAKASAKKGKARPKAKASANKSLGS
jgi:hypothetical protein